MKMSRVFGRNLFAPHPPPRPRCLRKPRRPSCVGRAFARGVMPGAFIWGLDLSTRPFKLSANPKTLIYMSCMHDLAMAFLDNMYSNTVRTAMYHLRPPARKPTDISSSEDESGSRASPAMLLWFYFWRTEAHTDDDKPPERENSYIDFYIE